MRVVKGTLNATREEEARAAVRPEERFFVDFVVVNRCCCCGSGRFEWFGKQGTCTAANCCRNSRVVQE